MSLGKANIVQGNVINTKFSTAIEGTQKALSRLSEAIDHIYDQFAPVLTPNQPVPEATLDKATPPMSDFDSFLLSTERRIYEACERLDIACERSSI